MSVQKSYLAVLFGVLRVLILGIIDKFTDCFSVLTGAL